MRVAALLLLTACGRFGFGAGDDATDDDAGSGSGSSDATVDAPAPSDLLLWYQMEDDASDGRLEDSAGTNQFALCVAGTTCGSNVAGKIGQAASFDGANDFYRILGDATLVTPTQFTVAFWIKIDALTLPESYAFTKRYAAIHNSWGVYFTQVADMEFESAREPGPTGDYDAVGGVPQLGVWTHFAITWDDTTKRSYVNGVRLLEIARSDIAFDTNELLLGADDDGTPFGFLDGALDDVRLYNRVLGDAEIIGLAGI